MDTQQILFLIILAGALALFISEKMRVDVTAMLTLMALALTGILDGKEALSGFSSEPAIIVAAVFVLSAGLAATGVTDRIGVWIGRAAGGSEWRAIAITIPAVAALAAVSHHLMVTAMMLPIMLRLARDKSIPASRLLMPMSLAASLGTTLTLFSAPAFLLAADLLERNGGEGLHVFSITPIGAALVLLGLVYMLLGRWLLPRRTGSGGETDYLKLDHYYTELVIEQDSRWDGKTPDEFQKNFTDRLFVVDWLRHGARQLSRGGDQTLAAGDVLLVRISPDEIASIRDEPGLGLHAVAKYGESSGSEGPPKRAGDGQVVQAVVAPDSEFIGRTVGEIDFARTLDVVVLGLWRRDGWLHGEVSQVVLRAGDLLVLWGRQQTLSELASHRGFLMLMPFTASGRQRSRAPVALGIMALSILAAATEILPAQIAFLAGAVAMVLTRCVDVDAAYRNIDVRIFVMIAGVIPLGLAMQKTGTAQLLADQLLRFANDWPPLTVLLVMFWAAALLTQIMSDAATTVLLAPVAFSVATALGLPPEPFVVCTALGAVASFLTPIGHHGNLLILNSGQYTFGDFLRIGVPLTVLISAVSAWMTRWLWLDGPLLPGL